MQLPTALRRIALAGACVAAFWLRCAFGHEIVFQPGGFVSFQDTDAWYHYRVIENLLAHFPWRITFDPYGVYPGGQDPRFGGLYDLVVGFAAWALGWGSPLPELIRTVTAWSPVALAALVPAAVYGLARSLFSTPAALAAAWIIAVLPGNWLAVSRLGFADHHVAEALFSTLALWGLMRSFEGRWTHAAWAGLALGAYLATWATGALLVLIVALWVGLDLLARNLLGRPTQVVSGRVAIALAVAWIFVAPFASHQWTIYTHLALGGALAGLATLEGLAALLRRRSAPRWALLALAVVGLATLVAVVAALFPQRFQAFLAEAARFQPTARQRTLAELRPILFYYGSFQLRAVWEQFAFSWLLAVPALLALPWVWRRSFSPSRSLFLFWTAFMLSMTLVQIRTAYYLAVCFAALAGAVAWKLYQSSPRPLRPVTAGALLFFLLWMNHGPAREILRADSGPSPDMRRALDWLAHNTPEPFSDPGFRLALYDRGLRSGDFDYPSTAYSVLCWWDLGHQINAVAGRIPSSNGFQTGGLDSARFYLATSEAEALPIADRLGARYVIVEPDMPLWTADAMTPLGSKFRAFPLWSEGEKQAEQYFEVYVRGLDDGGLEPVVVFYPDYYRSMMARMYLFDGEAVEPRNSVWVLSWRKETTPGVKVRRRIVSQVRFETHAEAVAYMAARPDQPLVLAGLDPARSCVPVEGLASFRPAHNTKPGPLAEETGRVRAVKIFERVN